DPSLPSCSGEDVYGDDRPAAAWVVEGGWDGDSSDTAACGDFDGEIRQGVALGIEYVDAKQVRTGRGTVGAQPNGDVNLIAQLRGSVDRYGQPQDSIRKP